MNREILNEAIDVVSSYAGGITDWVVIKKELLKTLTPADRMYFSTRDPVTKIQRLNDFERIVIDLWQQKTGIRLILKNHEEK